MEFSSYQNPPYFLNLPDLVVRKLIKMLDLNSLLALRLVCKTTKSLVQDNKYLIRKFKVPIKSNTDLQDLIINTEDTWTNLSFMDELSLAFDRAQLSNFFSTFHDRIEILEFNNLIWNANNFNLISSCSKLKSLSISILQIQLKSNPIEEDVDTKPFQNLQRLSVKCIHFENSSQLTLFTRLINMCSNLDFLLIPRPQGPPEVTWTNTKELQRIYIIQPILEHMNLTMPPSFSKSNRITILDVSQVFAKEFGPLAIKCVSTGTLLQNVNDKQIKYVFHSGDEFLTRVLSIREKIDDRRPLEKWINLVEMSIRTCRCDIRNYYEEIETFPRLKRLYIDFDSVSRNDPGFVALNRVISLLIKTKRPSVQELRLKWPKWGHDTPTNVVNIWDIINNFQNLRKLIVVNWCLEEMDRNLLRVNLVDTIFCKFYES